jgi:hypothetical protein
MISQELKARYIALLNKAQAFQICASVNRAVDCRKLQSELVELYKYKEQNNELEVAARVARLDQFLDDKIERLDAITTANIIKFTSEKSEDSWLYAKVGEIYDNTVTILHNMEERKIAAPSREEIFRVISEGITIVPKGEVSATPGGEPAKRPTFRKPKSPTGRVTQVWDYVEKIPANEEITGREVAKKLGLPRNEIKSVSDTLRHLYNRKMLKRKLVNNQYRYWKGA